MNEIRSKSFSETWDGTPNAEALQPLEVEGQILETAEPMSAPAFNALLADLGQRVAAIRSARAVDETAPVPPAIPEQPAKELHQMDAEEFRAHTISHWKGMTDEQDARRPAPPMTVSQYLAGSE